MKEIMAGMLANNPIHLNYYLRFLVVGDRFVIDALHDTQPKDAGCMAGTRETVLCKFMIWVKNDPMRISWLAGMAGTGKTSIALTLCRMLYDDPGVILGGTFFCSRSAGSIARTEVRRILVTLTVSIATQSPEYAAALLEELKANDHIAHKHVGDQIIPLVVKPCSRLTSLSCPVVFVIDALDECSNERELSQLLIAIADMKCDAPVKFILTSRPEMHIRGTPISNPDHSTILQLHTISEVEVMADIKHYITGTLQAAAPDANWYTSNDVQRLAIISHGLFIFASTALKYVLDPDNDGGRAERMRKATSAAMKRTAAIAVMDKMYELVLTDASREDKVDEDELEKMKRILACILTTRAPLSLQALADLMEIKSILLRGSLRRLHSLVYLPLSDTEPGLRTLHASFGDYFFHRSSCRVRTAASLGHDILARGCLRRMAWDDLCFNVSRSRSAYELNPVGQPFWLALSLTYTCLHWAHHIDAATDRSAFDSEIERIFRHKFLFWLEVLSVLQAVSVASDLLRIARSTVSLVLDIYNLFLSLSLSLSLSRCLTLFQVKRNDVSEFLRDAKSFVVSSRMAIERSAPHIYLSALPFAPRDSLIYKTFSPLCTGLASVETFGIDRHGRHLVMTLTGHNDGVNSVAYSPDGNLITSGSDDGTLRIWDILVGEETKHSLHDGGSRFLSIAFSPDGAILAAGTEAGVVCVWRFLTGHETLQRLCGHALAAVVSVAFSPNGLLLASGACDKTVRLWRATTGQQLIIISDHNATIREIAFSLNSATLACGYVDGTIRLRNSATGRLTGEPIHTSTSSCEAVCFSPNGAMLAQSSHRGVIRLLKPQTGRYIATLRGHSNVVRSMQFSPDGQSLVSASDDLTVRRWTLGENPREAFSIVFEGM